MARRGFNGFGNMGDIMKQVQKMQKDAEKKQDELKTKEFEVTVGGGAVYVKANGNREILKIKIKQEVVDDVEMLEDLIMVAVNEVMKKVDEAFTTEMSKIAPNIPGLF